MDAQNQQTKICNPFRPGAGHKPPYLAGREHESKEFALLLDQEIITKNLILTGLRGIGKTVLLDTFKPAALEKGWFWTCTDLSESSSVTEERLALRLLADLAIVTNSITIDIRNHKKIGFIESSETETTTLNFGILCGIYESIPGLIADKLKGVLEFAWTHIEKGDRRGIIFAYDEAQNLEDHSAKNQFPVALLLDVFQSLQRKGVRFMLALTGLPTLFPKLVEARTYAERMFHILFLNPLNETETFEAIRKPFEKKNISFQFSTNILSQINKITRGYPYFIQYICREVFDIYAQNNNGEQELATIPSDVIDAITRKLDVDFFAGRWSRATDRQRELLSIIARLSNCRSEFTVQEIVEHPRNKSSKKSFSNSHVNQMLGSLCMSGLIYKNRHGKYSFAVPLLEDFILRQEKDVSMFSFTSEDFRNIARLIYFRLNKEEPNSTTR